MYPSITPGKRCATIPNQLDVKTKTQNPLKIALKLICLRNCMAGLTKKEIEFAIIINKTATKLLYTITTLPTYTSNNNIIIII